MTYDEAKKLAAVLAEADSGCPHCVAELCDYATKAFPDFVWAWNGLYPGDPGYVSEDVLVWPKGEEPAEVEGGRLNRPEIVLQPDEHWAVWINAGSEAKSPVTDAAVIALKDHKSMHEITLVAKMTTTAPFLFVAGSDGAVKFIKPLPFDKVETFDQVRVKNLRDKGDDMTASYYLTRREWPSKP